MLFGMEVSVYLRTSAGVEKDLRWVEKHLSINGFGAVDLRLTHHLKQEQLSPNN